MSTKKISEMSFEELMDKLRSVLSTLEKGELSLEDSMRNYENGVILVRHAEEKLKSMEGRMEEIMSDGSIKELEIDLAKGDNSEPA